MAWHGRLAVTFNAVAPVLSTDTGVRGDDTNAPFALLPLADSTLARIQPAQQLDDMADCDLVVEAIVENLELKQQFFRGLESVVRPDCILATNTSSLSVTVIAAACESPDRVAGWHFFNPVPRMRAACDVR